MQQKECCKKKLAEEVTVFIHGKAEYEKAVDTTQKLFAQKQAPAESFSIEDLESIEGIVKSVYDRNKIIQGSDILSFLTDNTIFESKGAAKKMIQNGGVSINRQKINDPFFMVDATHLLHDRFILIQVGKKNYYLVSV